MLLIKVIYWLYLAVFVGLPVCVVITCILWKKRAINLSPVRCPSCGCPMKSFRVPKNLRQALWGGGTCSSCGSEMDKWGKLIER